MTPTVPCAEPGCTRPATGKGRCDRHRRELERTRSRGRRGGLKRGAYDIAWRDQDPGYRYPRRSEG
jgi:hypothetical protein